MATLMRYYGALDTMRHAVTSSNTDTSAPGDLTRRSFLGGSLTLICSLPLISVGCSKDEEDGSASPQQIDGWTVPPHTSLEPATFALLAALMDALIPPDGMIGGATQAHAAWYLDQLLGAFDVDPPRIYAGGPYSGRHGGQDGFSRFQPLTRVEEIRWRTYIEGSLGMIEREFNGPVVGLRQRYEEGLASINKMALSSEGKPFTALDLKQRQTILLKIEEDFRQLVYEHAVEGTYGDPVYGGNFEMRGWRTIDYEGDRLPIGYTAKQMIDAQEK